MPDRDEHDLTEEDLLRARALVPIVCIDVLPWRRADRNAIEVCLIEREDRPGQWNLVGGRIRRGEHVDAAVRRHMRSTLGPKISWTREDFSRPGVAGQYFPTPTAGHGHDPRQHSVSLSYALEVAGDVESAGEATTHRWFGAQELPSRERIGYDQADVVYALTSTLPPSRP